MSQQQRYSENKLKGYERLYESLTPCLPLLLSVASHSHATERCWHPSLNRLCLVVVAVCVGVNCPRGGMRV